MSLNLRVNSYPVELDKEFNAEALRKHAFEKVGFMCRLMMKPQKNESIWWSKNCELKYLDDKSDNVMVAVIDSRAGSEIICGTSAYLWYRSNKISRISFQIIKNQLVASVYLNAFKYKVSQFIGYNPTLTEPFSITWESKYYKFTVNLPQNGNGGFDYVRKFPN